MLNYRLNLLRTLGVLLSVQHDEFALCQSIGHLDWVYFMGLFDGVGFNSQERA